MALPISIIKTTPCVKFRRKGKVITATFSRAIRKGKRWADAKVVIEKLENKEMFRFRFYPLEEPVGRKVRANEASWPSKLVFNLDWIPTEGGSRVIPTLAPDGWWYGNYTDRIE
ncbi:hypothetical protein MOC16_gp310 [Klebsiella phage vB_KpM_FBKp24]|uniref:Uncharacterized protein n=1 Tax=Klebsiella phage vB_KpM_FBKp24 TaxID=2801834 RepID=A0A7U0GBQ4_9CAUD|nr:hypothetical protein [Klebsiella pneumoniae]YP_010298740.1 hypothetical protein MOC16_gp310 [Klebsiella phage vB_KpM_FBKp24]QQV92283.1 hypothetical protein vBKpMFBKp24_103 [Klebsiella phage vB_KpM_FBKp24]